MATYVVYLPKSGQNANKIADRAEFVREGFSFRAFVLGPLWLAGNRLWLALATYVAGLIIIGVAILTWHLPIVSGWLMVGLMDFYIGCDAAGIIGAKLRRRSFRMADVVVGSKMDDVERRFFSRWQPFIPPVSGEAT